MRYQGRISTWKDDQGFGFITPNGGGGQVFVHIKSFADRRRRPIERELVTYELKSEVNGRPQADRVGFVGEPIPTKGTSKPSRGPLILAAAFLLFVAVLVVARKLPTAVLAAYVVASGVAFFAYALDKSAAKRGTWRTHESTLHLLSVIGGWPGAVLAQRLLHHKSRKHSFLNMFWATVALNCIALVWLCSASGLRWLHSFLEA